MPETNTTKTEKHQNPDAQDKAKMAQKFLKEIEDKDLGIYCDIFSAKSSIEGQDGGIATSLLLKGFEEGLFDAAIVVRRRKGYSAEAVVAENPSDVLAAKGTKYLKVNVTKKLRELISCGKKRIAIVCTPCEAKTVRKIQQTLNNDYEITIIGLFCFEAFNSAKLKDEIKARFDVDLDKVEKTQVQQGKFIMYFDRKEISCKVKDLDVAAEGACRFCDDFTTQLSDISVGSVGSKKGYSTLIVRTKAGGNLLKNLNLSMEPVDKEEIIRLSKFKRSRAKKSLEEVNKPK
jgi:coenzyme F420-reducing hydrogenase beta subunit